MRIELCVGRPDNEQLRGQLRAIGVHEAVDAVSVGGANDGGQLGAKKRLTATEHE